VTSNERADTNERSLSILDAKRKCQKGVTTVEYAVMLVLIAIAVMIADPNLSSSVGGVFSDISSRLAVQNALESPGLVYIIGHTATLPPLFEFPTFGSRFTRHVEFASIIIL